MPHVTLNNDKEETAEGAELAENGWLHVSKTDNDVAVAGQARGSTPLITLRLQRSEAQWRIEISDAGHGVSAEDAARGADLTAADLARRIIRTLERRHAEPALRQPGV